MYSEIADIKISGMCSVLPEHTVDNLSYADVFGEEEVKKQIKVTGIRTRRCLTGEQTIMDLNRFAVDTIMRHTGWHGGEVGVVIYVSAYGNTPIPATAYELMRQMGAGEDCIGFDINLGCSAFVNGLYTMSALLSGMPDGAKGVLVVSDSTSIGGDHADKTVSMLSGDCACAIAVEKARGTTMKFMQKFDGSRYDYLVRKDVGHNLQMDGMAVFNFAITDVADSIRDFFVKFGLSQEEDFDYFILHQAQKFIVNKVAGFSDIPKKKLLISYNQYGNTGGPSLPATVCANIQTLREKEKVNLFFAGFGSGLSWAFVTVQMKSSDVIEPFYTDEVWRQE